MRLRHLINSAKQVELVQPRVRIAPELDLECGDRRLQSIEGLRVLIGDSAEQVDVGDPRQAAPQHLADADQRLDPVG